MATSDKLKARFAKRRKENAAKKANRSQASKIQSNNLKAKVEAGRALHQIGGIGKTSNAQIQRNRAEATKTGKSMLDIDLNNYNNRVSKNVQKPAVNKTVNNIANNFTSILRNKGQKGLTNFTRDVNNTAQNTSKYSSFINKYSPDASKKFLEKSKAELDNKNTKNRYNTLYQTLYTKPKNGTGSADGTGNGIGDISTPNAPVDGINGSNGTINDNFNNRQQDYLDKFNNVSNRRLNDFKNYQTELTRLNGNIFDIKNAGIGDKRGFANREAQLGREQANRDKAKAISLAEQSRNKQAGFSAGANAGLGGTTSTMALELGNIADKFNLNVQDINRDTADQVLKVQQNYNSVLRDIADDDTLNQVDKIKLQQALQGDLYKLQSDLLNSEMNIYNTFNDENAASDAAIAKAANDSQATQDKFKAKAIEDLRNNANKDFSKLQSEVSKVVQITPEIRNNAYSAMMDSVNNGDQQGVNEIISGLRSAAWNNAGYKSFMDGINAKKTKASGGGGLGGISDLSKNFGSSIKSFHSKDKNGNPVVVSYYYGRDANGSPIYQHMSGELAGQKVSDDIIRNMFPLNNSEESALAKTQVKQEWLDKDMADFIENGE